MWLECRELGAGDKGGASYCLDPERKPVKWGALLGKRERWLLCGMTWEGARLGAQEGVPGATWASSVPSSEATLRSEREMGQLPLRCLLWLGKQTVHQS